MKNSRFEKNSRLKIKRRAMKGSLPVDDTARRVLWLFMCGLIFALGINAFNPRPMLWVEDWARLTEAQIVKQNVPLAQLSDMITFVRAGSRLLVDARPARLYADAHLPGAVSLPLADLNVDHDMLEQIKNARKSVVLYGAGPQSYDSLPVALYLRESGKTDIAIFPGGMSLWNDEGLSTEGTFVE